MAGGIAIRIGGRSSLMGGLLSLYGASEAVFIIAYSPYSRVMPPGWNRRTQARLAQAPRRGDILPATGCPQSADPLAVHWPTFPKVKTFVQGDAGFRPAERHLAATEASGEVPESVSFRPDPCYKEVMADGTKDASLSLAQVPNARLVAMRLHEIEGNPLSVDQIAMFEMFERLQWSHERRRSYIIAKANPLAAE
jgi:hypothetical protein